MTLNQKIGKNLKKARLKLNKTQVEVANVVGIHPNFYARIERDQETPSMETFLKILKVLKIKSGDVLPF